ncbi:MAG: chromosomal replication initiator protein DnaA [Clostridia bacterium]|nr:chromosomal replication initiator protein DnaA [Clostridia bacterium]
MTFKNVWEKTLVELEQLVSKNALEMWIGTLEPVAYEDDAAVMISPSPFQRDIVMSKYKDIISAAMSEVVGFEITINVLTPEERKRQTPTATIPQPESKVEESIEQITATLAHPEFTFENFVVGESNRHAHAACLAVSQNPSGAYNPLFIYGSTGLGKTHLLFAIQNEIHKRYPNKVSLYVRSEDFTNEFIESVKNNTQTEFKNKYRTVDLFMMDDVQFIGGKESTQTEFFHTFEALYSENKQIILVSDRPPRDIQLLTDRMRSRFESGVIVSVGQPEYELKAAIISQRCQFYGMNLTDDVISFIAHNVKSNIRQIEGVLKKMMAYRLISNSTPNMAIAQSAINDITNENQPLPVLIDKILLEVSREYDVTIDEICSTRRLEKFTNARQVAMYIMREITSMSLPEIGKQFSNRDHSTVHHAIERIEYKIRQNPNLKLRIDDIIKTIREK